MKPLRFNPFIASVALALSFSGSAHAVDYQWDVNGSAAGLGGTGTWNTTNTFWDLVGTAPDDGTAITTSPTFNNADTATFGGTAGTVTLGSTLTVANVSFASGYTLAMGGQTLNLGNSTGSPSSAFRAISGAGTINVTPGTGQYNLGADANFSAFTGTINIAGGTGKAQFSNAFGGLSSSAAVNMAANSTLFVNGSAIHAAALTLNGGDTGEGFGQLRLESGNWSGNITLAGDMTGSGDSFLGSFTGAATISGKIGQSGGPGGTARELSRGGFQGTIILTNSGNDYTGGTRLNAATLAFANGALGTTGNITMNGGTLQWLTGNLQDISSRLIMVANTTATMDTGGNNVELASGFGSSTTGLLTKTGAGTLSLSGTNTYTGRTTVSNGTLALAFGGVSSNILSSSSALTLGGGTLQLTGTGTQTVNGLTTTASTGSRILLGANQTLTLGGLTSAGANSALNFNTAAGGGNASTPAIGSSLVVLTGQTAGNVINSGFTVTDAGGFGLATVNGSNQVVRLTTGTLLPATGATSATDYRIDNNAGGVAAAGSSSLAVTASASAKSITTDTTTANGVLTLSSGVTLSNNTWNFGGAGSNTYQITGGTGLNSVASANAISINNYNPNNVTIASPILANGINALSINGTGTTVFTGANAYTGGTTISNGSTVLVGNGGTTGTLGSGALVNNGILTYNLVGTSTQANLGNAGITGITGSGNTSITADTISFGSSGFTATTTGNQSYIATRNDTTFPKGLVVGTSGNYNFTTIGGASITMKGDLGASGGSTATVNLDTSAGSGTINLDISVGRSGQFFNIGAINANAGTGAINWTGTYGDVRSTSSQSTPITLTGAINMASNFSSQSAQTLTMNAMGTSTVTGALKGTINLVKGGTEKLTISGANTFSGTTTINQGILEIGGSGTLGAATYAGNISIGNGATLAFNSSATQTLSGIISNPAGLSGSLTKAGSGSLTLSNANTYSGGTTFSGGVIRVSSNNAALGIGTLSVTSPTLNGSVTNLLATASGGGARALTNDVVVTNNGLGTTTLQLDGGFADLRLNGNISGNGRIETASSGRVLLMGTNTYTGSTTLTGTNTLVLSGSNTTSGISVGTGTTLALRTITLGATQNITGSGNVTKDILSFGASSIAGTNNNYTGSTIVNLDRFTLASGGVINGTSSITVLGQFSAEFRNLGTVTTPGAVTVNGSSAAADGIFNNGDGTLASSLTAASISLQSSFISNAANTAKGGSFVNQANASVNLGAGAITVNGQGNSDAGGMVAAGSTFTNAGSVSAGSITLNSSSTANTVSNKGGTYTQTGGSTTLSGTATLAANSGAGAAGTAGNDAAFNISGGTFAANTIAVNSGSLTATAGTITLGSGGITKTGTAPTSINLGATTLAASAAWTSSVDMSLTNSTTGTTINTSGGNIGLSGELGGSGGKLVKSGSGTLTLSGTSTYTGATLVSAGTLLVNGALGNTPVTLDPLAIIGGTGTIGGSLTLASNSIFNIVNVNDSLTVTGTITLGSGFGIANLSGIDWNALDINTPYTLISTGQTFGVSDIANFGSENATAVGTGRQAYFTSGSLAVVVIPEPSSLLLGGLGLLALLRRRRA